MRFTSALPLQADIREGAAKRLLMTQSGHSLDCVVQRVLTELVEAEQRVIARAAKVTIVG